jgi:integrase
MKPSKPTPDYPLYAHSSGQWAKKVNGKVKYFGKWDNPQAALEAYEQYIGAGTKSPAGTKRRDRKAGSDGRLVAKPYADFPLYAHACGQWAKRIRGKIRYFGPVNDWKAALERYKQEKDDWQAGRIPQAKVDSIRLKELVNRFLAAKEHEADCGAIERATFDDYDVICGRILECFDPGDPIVEEMQPDDFRKLEAHLLRGKRKRHGKVSFYNDITRSRVLFKWAEEEKWIPRPVTFGQAFKKPSRKELRQERQKRPKKMFESQEIRKMLAAASQPIKTMILLGVNCGFGNADCARLPIQSVDLNDGWIRFPRPKTGVKRRCPLWPETISSLKEVLAKRKPPKNESLKDCVFVTKYGNTWAPDNADPIGNELGKVLEEAGIAKRFGVNFYALRHTFRTIGGRSKDQIAVDHIMGHAPESDDMRHVYDEEMTDDRLYAVVDYVRKWVFSSTSSQAADGTASIAWSWSEVPKIVGS